jgi:hypothetical protein
MNPTMNPKQNNLVGVVLLSVKHHTTPQITFKATSRQPKTIKIRAMVVAPIQVT